MNDGVYRLFNNYTSKRDTKDFLTLSFKLLNAGQWTGTFYPLQYLGPKQVKHNRLFMVVLFVCKYVADLSLLGRPGLFKHQICQIGFLPWSGQGTLAEGCSGSSDRSHRASTKHIVAPKQSSAPCFLPPFYAPPCHRILFCVRSCSIEVPESKGPTWDYLLTCQRRERWGRCFL